MAALVGIVTLVLKLGAEVNVRKVVTPFASVK
jgi:hypothetical protein